MKLAEGSINKNDRMTAAAVRALDAHIHLERTADRLLEELDQITSPGVVRTQITDEDSLVIAIRQITQDHSS
ncbi:MAG TPA: hypothetical protein VN181_07545 [Thermoanaerobaculia bacterium]|nr:hypothetical protein [Thermoanaerobaculia bacterium]